MSKQVTEKLMPMMQNGLAKLIEECGEVLQIAGKLVQYPHLQQPGTDELHPDGTHLRTELQNEMADVIAAFEFVAQRLQLSNEVIDGRVSRKVALFELWDRERAAQETRPECPSCFGDKTITMSDGSKRPCELCAPLVKVPPVETAAEWRSDPCSQGALYTHVPCGESYAMPPWSEDRAREDHAKEGCPAANRGGDQ
jgi:NTP pyrophosphatase (non-canonical NTP hydrolase)